MVPHFEKWEKAGIMDREIYAKAMSQVRGLHLPESHGGGGSDDFRFNVVINEELQYAGLGGAGNGITLVNDIPAPYFIELSTADSDRWLPGLQRELISAVAMTEPGTGSDLASIATRAVRDGDEWSSTGPRPSSRPGSTPTLWSPWSAPTPTLDGAYSVLERGMAGSISRNLYDQQKSSLPPMVLNVRVRPTFRREGERWST